MTSMNLTSTSGERNLGIQWVVATVVGWGIGFFLCEALNAFLASFTHSDGLVIGTAVGVAQGLVLRRRIAPMGWWVLTSAIGFGVGKALGEAVGQGMPAVLGHGLAGAIIGAVVGVAQWLVLRGRVARAEWWVVANVVAWAIGWSVISLVEHAEGTSTLVVYLVGGAGAAMAGIVTGIALIALSRTRPA